VLNLANVANTGTVTNVETITGNAAADVITMGAAVTAGVINLAAGTDSVIFGKFTNSATISNTETITGGTGASTITLGTTLTGVTLDLGRGADSLILANVANTGSLSNVETITGGTGGDAITLATQVTAGTVNLGGGTDSLTLGNFANSATSADTFVFDHAGASDLATVKMFGVSGADKIALDITDSATRSVDAFDIGSGTLTLNTNIKRMADYDAVLATTLTSGAGAFVYDQGTGSLYYSNDGDFSGGGDLVGTIYSSGTTAWTINISGFMLV
jgi:hypothetical protein